MTHGPTLEAITEVKLRAIEELPPAVIDLWRLGPVPEELIGDALPFSDENIEWYVEELIKRGYARRFTDTPDKYDTPGITYIKRRYKRAMPQRIIDRLCYENNRQYGTQAHKVMVQVLKWQVGKSDYLEDPDEIRTLNNLCNRTDWVTRLGKGKYVVKPEIVAEYYKMTEEDPVSDDRLEAWRELSSEHEITSKPLQDVYLFLQEDITNEISDLGVGDIQGIETTKELASIRRQARGHGLKQLLNVQRPA